MAVALDIAIRLLRPADAGQVADLLTEAFAEEFAGAGTDPRATLRMVRAESWAQRGLLRPVVSLVSGDFAFFVAATGNRIVGCTAVAGQQAPVISSVAVVPGLRRHGIARALLSAAEGFAASHGSDRVVLDVLAHNTPALNLYLATGYEEFHRYSTFVHPCGNGSVPPLPRGYQLIPARPRPATDLDAIEWQALPESFRAVMPPRGRYTSGPPELVERLLAGTRSYRRLLLNGEQVRGYLLARALPGQHQGRIAYPIFPPEETGALPAALGDALRFLGRCGCATARVDLSDGRPDQQTALAAAGWTRTWTFVQMVKRLTRSGRIPVRDCTGGTGRRE